MAIIDAGLFCLISFLNYMNRYTTPPIVGRLKNDFQTSDTLLGSIQCCFELCYVATAPLFGFLGDRFSRCYIIAASLLFTAIMGLISSLVPESSFLLLLTTRALLGIGEACATNICPSLIGDMFIGRKRTIALSIYQFAIPLGCGVGYMASGAVADYTNNWRWAFRVTPLPMLLAAICLLVFVRDPQRGEAENATGLHQTTSYTKDLAYLVKIPSFTLSSLANVGAAFATGALTFWAPDLIMRMLTMKGATKPHSESEIGLIFGVITIASGILGVATGAILSNGLLKSRCGLAADGMVCGFSMLLAAPIMYAGLVYVPINVMATWVLMFFGIAALSCCYVLLSEITLNVVIETRRATARSFQSTVSHFFGDACSPYISGLISDQVRKSRTYSELSITRADLADFQSMQTSLFLSTIVIVISGGLFLYGSLYINEDAEATKCTKTAPDPELMLETSPSMSLLLTQMTEDE